MPIVFDVSSSFGCINATVFGFTRRGKDVEENIDELEAFQNMGSALLTSVDTALSRVVETELQDPKLLSMTDSLAQAPALKGEHSDEESEYSTHEKIVLPAGTSVTNPIDAETWDVKSHKDSFLRLQGKELQCVLREIAKARIDD